MIFIDAVPGCETRNLDFFISHGFADTAQGAHALASLVCDYLKNDGKTAEMKTKLQNSFGTCATEIIFNHVCKGN